jgi:hypothetical protein
MFILSTIITTIQQTLFPALEAQLAAPLGKKGELFVTAVELIRPERFIDGYEWKGVGSPRKWRLAILLSFIAKAVWNFSTNRALLDRLRHDQTLRRLCGWESIKDVPSESTFSRAFAEFAHGELPQVLHEALVREGIDGKLMGHASTDATAIVGRERPFQQPEPTSESTPLGLAVAEISATPAATVKRGPGRPRKGEPTPIAEPKRLELQPTRTLAENLADLPKRCDRGCKRSAQGYKVKWDGYKFHVVTVDADFPVGAALTSASLHDSQVAIPLMQMAAQRVDYLYDLQDAAYDAQAIIDFSKRLGHVPIIDANPRGSKTPPPPMDPARAERYKGRSAAERTNSDLKDNHGGNNVRVRGPVKVFAHLMFGLLVVTVKGICRLIV